MVKYELSEDRKALKTRLGTWMELPDSVALYIKAECEECTDLDRCIGSDSRELHCEVFKGLKSDFVEVD